MEEPLPTTTTDGNSNTNTNSPNTNSSITIDETSNLSTSSDNIYVENMVKMNPFLQCFVNYYSSSPNHKESVILNPHYEDIYLPGGRIKFNRWFLFPSAFIVQFCIGSLYASSIFNKPIDAYIFGNPAAGMAPITFYIAVALFGTSACLLGPWVERVGPRISMVVGSGLFTIGHFITAFGIHQKAIWEVYVGYGVIGGIGLGITYLSPISCLQKWFCDKRGLAAGFAVCGFGAGAIGFSQSLLPIIDKVGLPITYVILGIIFICVIWPQAILFRVPPPNYVINGVRVDGRKEAPKKRVVVEEDGAQISRNIAEEPTIEDDIFSREKIPLSYALTSREFRLIYVVFLCNAIFGLAAMSRLSNMIQDIFGQSKEAAALVVGVNGAFNLVGRLGFAFVSDLYGRKSCFIAMLSIQTVIIGLMPIIIGSRSYIGYILSVWIITSCYGGGFGTIPAFLTDMFGPQNVSACHGVILTAWAISGVGGGLIFTSIFNYMISHGYTIYDIQVYTTNTYWLFAVALIGWMCLPFIRTSPRDIYLPAIPGQIFRIRILGKMVRLSRSQGLEFVKRFQEDEEWYQFLYTLKKHQLQKIEREKEREKRQSMNAGMGSVRHSGSTGSLYETTVPIYLSNTSTPSSGSSTNLNLVAQGGVTVATTKEGADNQDESSNNLNINVPPDGTCKSNNVVNNNPVDIQLSRYLATNNKSSNNDFDG